VANREVSTQIIISEVSKFSLAFEQYCKMCSGRNSKIFSKGRSFARIRLGQGPTLL
jgi:hypothetical protein